VIGPVGGPLEGFAILAVDVPWCSDVPYLSEWAVFVRPDCRCSDHAALLHDWLKMQVETTRLPMILGIMAPSHLEAKCRLYRRRFGKVGEFFMHTPPYYQCQADLSGRERRGAARGSLRPRLPSRPPPRDDRWAGGDAHSGECRGPDLKRRAREKPSVVALYDGMAIA
jgi:hypothetical protein